MPPKKEIKAKVKAIIAAVSGLDPVAIGDASSLKDELGIDSLSRLEIGVDVDYSFQLKLPDETYKDIDTVEAMVALVEAHRATVVSA